MAVATAPRNLTDEQLARLASIEATVADEVRRDAHLGIGAPLDPDELLIDLLVTEPDPVLADAIRHRFGVGVTA